MQGALLSDAATASVAGVVHQGEIMFAKLTPELLDLTGAEAELGRETFGVWDDLCGGPLCSCSLLCFPPPSAVAE
jgi:hypothetical protein